MHRASLVEKKIQERPYIPDIYFKGRTPWVRDNRPKREKISHSAVTWLLRWGGKVVSKKKVERSEGVWPGEGD